MTHPRIPSARRLPLLLASASAALGLTGGALALAMTAGGTAAASPASAHRTATTMHVQDWPYFACVSVGNFGVCVGPPTN